MTDPSATSPTDEAPAVEITADATTIQVRSRALFSDGDDAAVRRLVAAALAVPEVEALDVDHRSARVTIRFDGRKLHRRDALVRVSRALQAAADATLRLPFELGMGLIAGRITRVERRRAAAGLVTTVVSSGADWFAACSRVVDRLRGVAEPENARAVNGAVVLHGLVVHSESVPAPTTGTQGPLATRGAREFDVSAPQTALGESARSPSRGEIVVARGVRRLAHLTAAGGCFVMTFVGLVTPGIPTVPFVLATSYFLVRSSPVLDERLRRSRLFGRMVRDWQAYGGMRESTKRQFILITLAIMGVTVLVAGPSILLLTVGAVMGTLGVTMIVRLPTVPEDAPDDLAAFGPA